MEQEANLLEILRESFKDKTATFNFKKKEEKEDFEYVTISFEVETNSTIPEFFRKVERATPSEMVLHKIDFSNTFEFLEGDILIKKEI